MYKWICYNAINFVKFTLKSCHVTKTDWVSRSYVCTTQCFKLNDAEKEVSWEKTKKIKCK